MPYVQAQKSKRSTETLQNIKSILSQKAADPNVVVHVHSDGGGEFTAARVVEELHKEAVWKTISAAYEPGANGRAERQVQAIKEKAISFILHSDMHQSFWSYAVRQAVYELRLEALGIELPMGTPRFGEPVAVRVHALSSGSAL